MIWRVSSPLLALLVAGTLILLPLAFAQRAHADIYCPNDGLHGFGGYVWKKCTGNEYWNTMHGTNAGSWYDGWDLIKGKGGQDTVNASGGQDSVYGGNNPDTLKGENGRDLVALPELE